MRTAPTCMHKGTTFYYFTKQMAELVVKEDMKIQDAVDALRWAYYKKLWDQTGGDYSGMAKIAKVDRGRIVAYMEGGITNPYRMKKK